MFDGVYYNDESGVSVEWLSYDTTGFNVAEPCGAVLKFEMYVSVFPVRLSCLVHMLQLSISDHEIGRMLGDKAAIAYMEIALVPAESFDNGAISGIRYDVQVRMEFVPCVPVDGHLLSHVKYSILDQEEDGYTNFSSLSYRLTPLVFILDGLDRWYHGIDLIQMETRQVMIIITPLNGGPIYLDDRHHVILYDATIFSSLETISLE
jgi:hypothetical protein